MDNGVDLIAKLMTISATTAPKAEDLSFVEIQPLDEAEKEILVEELFQMAEEDEEYSHIGEIISESDKVMLLGLEEHPPFGLDCKACGFKDCLEFSKVKTEHIFQGPNCVYRILDLGIAIGSALKTADAHNVRADILIKAGLAAKHIGLSTSNIVMAVPIYIQGSDSFF